MKKKGLLITVILAVVVSLVAGCAAPVPAPAPAPAPTPAPAPAEEFTTVQWKFSSDETPEHPRTVVISKFQDMVTELTDGAITWQNFYAGSLQDEKNALPGLRSGVCDMTHFGVGYFISELPLTAGLELPGIHSAPDMFHLMVRDLMAEFPLLEQEHIANNVKILGALGADISAVAAKERIETVEQLKGKKVRSYGHVLQVVGNLGASPVAIGGGEVYEALLRGTIDINSGQHVLGMSERSLWEAGAKYVSDPGIGFYSANYIVVNLESWNNLNAATQRVMIDASEAAISQEYAKALSEGNQLAAKRFIDNGSILYRWSETEQEKVRELGCKPVWSQWIAGREKEGIASAADFLEAYKQISAKYASQSVYTDAFDAAEELTK